MIDYQTLSTTPTDEPCASINTDFYFKNMRIEAQVFRNQLIRQHGPPPDQAYFQVKQFPHDFGSYHELCIYYNDEAGAAVEYAFTLEGDLPEKWDEQAKEELMALHYPFGELEKAKK